MGAPILAYCFQGSCRVSNTGTQPHCLRGDSEHANHRTLKYNEVLNYPDQVSGPTTDPTIPGSPYDLRSYLIEYSGTADDQVGNTATGVNKRMPQKSGNRGDPPGSTVIVRKIHSGEEGFVQGNSSVEPHTFYLGSDVNHASGPSASINKEICHAFREVGETTDLTLLDV